MEIKYFVDFLYLHQMVLFTNFKIKYGYTFKFDIIFKISHSSLRIN